MLVQPNSLAATLDAIGQALFYERTLPAAEIEAATRWLSERQVRSGKWAGMFAPTGPDYGHGVTLFSKERLRTRLAAKNVLTAEAARALTLFGGAGGCVDRANRWLGGQCFAGDCMVGECAHSGIGLMRYVAVRDGDRAQQWLEDHVERLSTRRDGKGRWVGLPFYYTLLALSEIDLPAAQRELCYAMPACERALKRLSGADGVVRRRRNVVHRALSRCT
ncbi:MAG: hypothetical protein PVI10_12190 [Methyloceanibacter sp.]|jgi:hypothetical protein